METIFQNVRKIDLSHKVLAPPKNQSLSPKLTKYGCSLSMVMSGTISKLVERRFPIFQGTQVSFKIKVGTDSCEETSYNF